MSNNSFVFVFDNNQRYIIRTTFSLQHEIRCLQTGRLVSFEKFQDGTETKRCKILNTACEVAVSCPDSATIFHTLHSLSAVD